MNQNILQQEGSEKNLKPQPIINRWELRNFQSIQEVETIDLKPLTIFSGPNSSGKSAIIKSLLMVAQSLDSEAREVPLVLNGKYTALGDFDHILHHGSDPAEVELSFIIKCQKGDVEVWVKIKQDPDSLTSMRVVKQTIKVWEDEDSRSKAKEYFELKYSPVTLQEASKKNASQILQEQINQGLFNYEIIKPTNIESHPQYEETVSTSLSSFLPGRKLIRVKSEIRNLTEEFEQARKGILSTVMTLREPIDWDRELSREARGIFYKVSKRIMDDAKKEPNSGIYTNNYSINVRSIWDRDPLTDDSKTWTIGRLTEYIKETLKKPQIRDLAEKMSLDLVESQDSMRRRSNQPIRLEVGEFPPQYSEVIQQIRRVFESQIFYLGPLRDDPRTIYAIPPLPNQRDVGLKGEYTAAMLEIHQNLDIDYPRPPSSDKFNGEYEFARGKLGEAVQVWLDRMGLAKSINATLTSKVGYQLEVRPNGVKQDLDLMSLGVGVSQVLPTIVMALLAPEDSVLIFEQPEVHLHPKVQSVLGDFFLGIVGCGKQCIVETHSEHLINRTRRRIAESEDTNILDQLQIYFVELQNGVSQFRSVEPNEFGAIMDWPTDFFDEVEKESSAIVRAAMEKRHKPRK